MKFIGILMMVLSAALAAAVAVPITDTYSVDSTNLTSIDPAGTGLDLAKKGPNCEWNAAGCAFCTNIGPYNIWFLVKRLDDNATFKDGHRIACWTCHQGPGALCIRADAMYGQPEVTGKQVKEAAYWITDNCSRCGAVPVPPRTNVDKGRLTMGYWDERVCLNRICDN